MKNKYKVLSSNDDLSNKADNHTEGSLPVDNTVEKIKTFQLSAEAILKQEITGLQIIPPVAVKLLKLTNDDASSFADLSTIIETDPSLSVEVLRLVNSAFYNLSNKISSIKRAATVLGFSSIRQLALNILLFKKMIKPDSRQEFDQIFFWQHCLFVAALSKIIAAKINHPDPDSVYSAGLLHDIGKLILESYGQLSYSDFLRSFEKSANSSLENERNFFGITHSEIGAVFCQTCNFPESITNTVLYHHTLNTSSIGRQEKLDVAIVAYADFIAWLQRIGSVTKYCYPVMQADAFEIINAYNLDLESILAEVDNEINKTSSFYDFHFPTVHELRANLVATIFNLNAVGVGAVEIAQNDQAPIKNGHSFSSLTVPHHSLNPDEFIPWTLEAIKKDFNFDRLIVLDIDPERRSLIAKYSWPQAILSEQEKIFEIMISTLSGQIVSCLRNKQAALINRTRETDHSILRLLKVDAFFCLPILMNNRLASVLYIDNVSSGNPLDEYMLSELSHVTNELGIAMVNASQFEQEKKKAQLDSLTGLNNKRMIDHFLSSVFDDQNTRLDGLAIGIIDIDYFKSFNDLYGHQAGDDVLKIVSDILKSITRPNDFIGRYGGEEFLFAIVDTNLQGVKDFSERIRIEIEKKGRLLKQRFPRQCLTVSIGAVINSTKHANYEELIAIADEAMYRSKLDGRNRVTVFS